MDWLRDIKTTFLDAIYPSTCVSCGAGGCWWCEACRNGVEQLFNDPCPKCLSADASHHPFACAGPLPFAGVVSAGLYHSAPLRKLIHALKYQGVTAAEADVEAWLSVLQASRGLAFPWQTEKGLVLQSMPLAESRERDRGFNQAAWLAERIQHAWAPQARIVSILARASSAMPQASIEDKALRVHNIANEFIATSRTKVSVLLVDDVVTTGSTAAEAARVLMGAGAPRVYLASLALGV